MELGVDPKKGKPRRMKAISKATFRGGPMARSMAFEDLATVVYVWVDDWFDGPWANVSALSGGDPVPGLHAGQPPISLSGSCPARASSTAGPGSCDWVKGMRQHWAERLGATCWTPSPWPATSVTRAAVTLRPRPPTGVSEVLRVQAGPALHPGGGARGLQPGAGLDG